MPFSQVAIKKLNDLIARGYAITSVAIDFTVHETDGKFSTLTVKVAKGDETGTIDQYGRVTWR